MTSLPKASSTPSGVPKKVSMSMMRGRPGSLSLPSFTFRFKNTEEEVLEEVTLGEIDEASEISEICDTNNKSADELSDATTSPPLSPMKVAISAIKPKISGKRTLSLDDGSPEHSATSDTWALFSEIKGKIARTVEEKLHSSGIYKKEVTKSLKAISPVEAEEATEDLESPEPVKAESSSPFSLRKMLSAYDSPQLRLRRKEIIQVQSVPTVQTTIEEVASTVSFSDLLSFQGEDEASKSKNSSADQFFTCNPTEVEAEIESELVHVSEPVVSEPPPELHFNGAPRNRWFDIAVWRQKWLRYKNSAYLFLLALFVWWIFPSFISGLMFGVALTFYANSVWKRLNKPLTTPQVPPPAAEPVVAFPPSFGEKLQPIRKVWMNELLSEYSPEFYHLSMTQSVLVRLDGSTLRVSYPQSKIHKRAMWNESINESSFIYQRYYDLSGAKIDILPDGLARKRRWSRRYPIQIECAETIKIRDSGTIPLHLMKENDKVVVLFARSGRDKEEWFWRFKEAILGTNEKFDVLMAAEYKLIQQRLFKYRVYMSRLIQPIRSLPSSDAGSGSSKQVDGASTSDSSSRNSPTPSLTDNVDWLNILLGRCCADVLLDSEDNEWIEKVSDRIQRKLSLIKVPYFMDELRLSDLEIGSQLPQIGNISSPYLNERGLWFHVSVSYYGSFRMTLETKLNLLRLKKEGGFDGVEMTKDNSNGEINSSSSIPRLSAIYDSEAEESVESSSDEEPFPDTQSDQPNDESGRSVSGNKIFRIVDSIAQSRYFQQATENKYVKKAMVGVSNTPLILTVELLSLSGTLAVNIPPPPTDRLWYGFLSNPDLVLVAKPKVGERQVQITHITEWIEKKLIVEFQRILVLPNMEDLVIPILNSSFLTTPPTSLDADPKEEPSIN